MNRLLAMLVFAILALGLAGCGTMTPLGRAANRGDITDIKRLLDAGENVNQGVFPLGSIHPLNEAVFNNVGPEIVQLLLEHGADINNVGPADGWSSKCGTPLHLAVHNRNARLVKLLLDNGADTGLKNCYNDNQTPLQLAQSNGSSPEIIKLLREAEARQYGRFEIATQETLPPRAARESSLPAPVAVIKSDVDTPPPAFASDKNNAYAVVVGIERYRQKLPAADFANHDAETVAEYLTKSLGYPEENVVTLINDHAALGDFVKYFEKWLPNNVEPGATVFVYYSGHGAPNPKTGDAYLVPYDGDPAFIDETGYSLKRMYAALGKLPAKEVVVALDSCFSGSGGRSVIAKGARAITLNLKDTALPSHNMTVLAASSGEQMSSTYDDKGHGLFTYFLLKGIKHEDVVAPSGVLRIDDLFAYLKPQVERVARKQYNNEQTPQLIETVR